MQKPFSQKKVYLNTSIVEVVIVGDLGVLDTCVLGTYRIFPQRNLVFCLCDKRVNGSSRPPLGKTIENKLLWYTIPGSDYAS